MTWKQKLFTDEAIFDLWFPLVLLLGGLFVLVQAVQISIYADASATWPRTTGAITKSEVKTRSHRSETKSHPTHAGRSESSTSYIPSVRYTYEIDGQRHEGATITFSFVGGIDSIDASKVEQIHESRESAELVLARYPVGKMVHVFYDPEAPERAVLEPGGEALPLPQFLLAAILIGIGVGWLIRSRLQGKL